MTRRQGVPGLLVNGLCLVLIASLVSCTIPRERDVGTFEKAAIDRGQVEILYERYRDVRDVAISVLDAKPLSVIESGPVLAIDSGGFQVAQNSGRKPPPAEPLRIEQLFVPRFDAYPMWFVVTAHEDDSQVRRVQVFKRERAVEPWRLVASPEMVLSASLPALRIGTSGSTVPVDPTQGVGMRMSAQEAAEAYVRALSSSDGDADIAQDDFIDQMRSSLEQNAAVPDAEVQQSWTADDVEFVLRTADGGALAFVTLRRTDTYQVAPGQKLTWPAGTVQEALLPEGITGTGSLLFNHQVLLHIPAGSGQPRAIGQYGGVIGVQQ